MELVDIYDKTGVKLNYAEDRIIAHKKGLIHRTVYVWILNDKNELLLQRRSLDNPRYPGKLEVSATGHVSAGEDSIQAIKRECLEEIGINIDIEFLEYLFSYRYSKVLNDYNNNEISDVYLYRYNVNKNDVKFNDNAVCEVVYIDYKKLEEMWKDNDPELINREEQYVLLFKMLKKYIIKG